MSREEVTRAQAERLLAETGAEHLTIHEAAAMGAVALALGLLTVTGLVQLWHVYVFAFLHGCAAAFDSPARHSDWPKGTLS